jgi:DNA-binding transcriptional ArsR family regulator
LSNKFKLLAKENKVLTDEIIKALIVDEGWIEDKIKVELANKELVKGLYEIISHHYMLAKLISRERHNISFKGLWNHDLSVWGFEFSAKSFQDLHKSISPLPIDYKQEALDFLYERQTRGYNQRKSNETKKLIIRSLLENSKTIGELAKELLVKQTTIRAHLKGHPSYREALIKLGIADRIGEKILRRGGFTRVGIYGIKNKKKAIDYLLL